MKIKAIRAFEVELNPPQKTKPRHPGEPHSTSLHRPLDRYPQFRENRTGGADWKRIACLVTAEDGTWGLGLTIHSAPVLPIINDQFAPLLSGENCMATEKLWDVMVRSTAPFGGTGLARYAISAVARSSSAPSTNCSAALRRTRSFATPPASTPNGIWNWVSRPLNSSPPGAQKMASTA